MQHKVETALKAGYQVNIHAIGDAANHQVLDAFEAAYRTVGGRQLRNRIEHAQVVALTDIPRSSNWIWLHPCSRLTRPAI